MSKAVAAVPHQYETILDELSTKIRDAQTRAMRAVNLELVEVYRDIGRTIYEQQQSGSWGDSVVEQLAKDLRATFPSMRGFSRRNLFMMRDFYLTYRESKKVQALTAQIGWTHNVVILSKCKDDLEREFYMKMTRRNGWSYRMLALQIENRCFEKTLTSQTSFEKGLPTDMHPEASLAVKDEYGFGFLDLADKYRERELERAIVRNIEAFLKEVGDAYCFVGSQYKLEVGGQEFFVDLLLYHRKLKSLVAIELKVTDFAPEFVGKMQFYLAVLDDKVRVEGENSSVGIILCRNKNRTVVEYALQDSGKPINVSSYHVVPQVPKELQDELPSLEQIEKLLDQVD